MEPIENSSLLEEVRKYHEFGHFGATALYRFIRHVMGRTNIPLSIVEKVVHNCTTCQLFSNGRISYLPQKNITAQYPLEMLCMDTLVMPTSDDGNIGVLIVVDLFTQFTLLYPISNHLALTTADCLLNVYSYIGIPEYHYSDQGTEFLNDVLKLINDSLLIKHSFSLVGSHVGTAEATCKQCLQMILKTVANEFGTRTIKSNWDKTIDLVQFAINSRVVKNGYTPFTLMFGRNPWSKKNFDNKSESIEQQRDKIIKNWTFINNTIYPQALKVININK